MYNMVLSQFRWKPAIISLQKTYNVQHITISCEFRATPGNCNGSSVMLVIGSLETLLSSGVAQDIYFWHHKVDTKHVIDDDFRSFAFILPKKERLNKSNSNNNSRTQKNSSWAFDIVIES